MISPTVTPTLRNTLFTTIPSAGGFSGLLDQYGGAAAAYSLRALSSGWLAGDVVRARRVNTPGEANFTAGQVANGELATWALSGDAFVTTWYDQSGNANNATQATTTAQPKIVSAGTLVVGGLDFDGVDDHLQYNYAITNPTSASLFSVFNNTGISDSGVVFGIRSGALDLIQLTSQDEGEDRLQVRDTGNSIVQVIANNFSRLNEHLASASFVKSTPIYNIDLNGGLVSASDSTSLSGTITSSKATIGATDDGSIISQLQGNIEEIIYYNSDQSANRVAIEANINAAYTIY